MTTERADQPRRAAAQAAAELRQQAAQGRLEARAVAAVLQAAGHDDPELVALRRTRNPGGLSRREVDVLRLAARGLTTQHITERLFISPKTADPHIRHICTKIGVSTRAAAMPWAMQHDLVR